MTSEHWKSVKAIFGDAIELSKSEREPFVRAACGQDIALLSQVLRMLVEHERVSALVSTPALGHAHPLDEWPGPRFAAEEVLAGRFRIIRFLAARGMGEVYEAEDLELRERVALKTIGPRMVADERVLALFKKEIQLARRVTHPNVCRIYDIVQHEESGIGRTLLLSMELVEGPTLTEYLRERGPLPCRDAIHLIEQIAAAVQAAHDRGIIHRDLKPGNIMLAANPPATKLRVVVTDFGLAHSMVAEGPAIAGGTPGYSAPEQHEGRIGTPSTDVYSLALVVAEMAGIRQHAKDLRAHYPADWPKEWVRVLERCLDPDPKQRYSRPADAAAALRDGLDRRFPRRTMLLAAASILTLAAAGLAGRWILRPHQPVWVIMTALDNRTGEPLLDDTVPYLLEREISNSSDVYVVPRVRTEDTLLLMRKDPKSRVDERLAREISLRDGGIQAIASTRAQRMGPGYLLSVNVNEVASGRSLGGASEQAATLGDVVAAVRRLASVTRRVAGERPANLGNDALRLQHVTTPSLPACKLYSQAYGEAQELNWARAERLARAAVAEDPQFASAYLWIAWAVYNQRKPAPEWQAALSRAVALSGSATDREHKRVEGSDARAIVWPEVDYIAGRVHDVTARVEGAT